MSAIEIRCDFCRRVVIVRVRQVHMARQMLAGWGWRATRNKTNRARMDDMCPDCQSVPHETS